jgi:hypothetical protein
MVDPAILDRLRKDAMSPSTMVVSRVTVRFVAGLLAVAVAVAHVANQGGVTALATPQWLGWSYRLVEVGGVVTALGLAWRRSVLVATWAGLAVGTVPFLSYLASLPLGTLGDPAGAGQWFDWAGAVALLVEAALVTVCLALRRMSRDDRQPTVKTPEATERERHASSAEIRSLWLPAGFK